MADIVRRRPSALRRGLEWPFRSVFDDLFERFGDEFVLPQVWAERTFVPAIDVSEDDESLTLTAEVPGMKKEDIEVTVDNGVLSLRGEKKEEVTKEGKGYHRVERCYGQFERQVRLPGYVDAERVEATYKDGVLTVRVPKAETAKAKAVQIK